MSCTKHSTKWFQNPLFLLCVTGLIWLFISQFMIPDAMLWHHFLGYVQLIWWAILLGLIIGGVIDYFIPSIYIERVLAGSQKRTILYAVGLGFLMSACSHGILAIAIQLYKKGASIPSVIAFLLASPWANLPLTLLLVGFFGLKAFFIIVYAIIVALITGYIFQFLESKGMLDAQPYGRTDHDPSFSILSDIKTRCRSFSFSFDAFSRGVHGIVQGMWSLSKMVLWWIILGLMIASVVRALVPQAFFIQYLGPTPLGLLYTLGFATVLEVCSEGTAPLAFELYHHTNAFGGVFVFLMAGVATDYTEIGLLWTTVGWRTALLLPLITLPQLFLIGLLLN